MFDGSAYQLSKCAIYSFNIFYIIITASAIMGFIGLTFHPLIFEIGFAIGSLSTWILAMYLPSLFIYKLYQINKKVNMVKNRNNNESESSERGILAVMKKCTILTIFSLITTWSVVIGGVMEIIVGSKFNVLVFWGYAIILDVNSNFVSVILSNSFCNDYYLKLCGPIERCIFDQLCCKNNNDIGERVGSVSPQSSPAMELSAYMESTQTTKETQSKQDDMDDLDLGATCTQNDIVS